MNTIVTSREAILQTSRELIRTQGWDAVNIRNVAKACDISVGSIYNYFQNKSSLVTATVESVWQDIFHEPENPAGFSRFTECIQWAYDCMRRGNETYPGFFLGHSMIFLEEEKEDGQKLMEKSWRHIKNGFYAALMQDPAIDHSRFDQEFTPHKFVDIIFSLILSSLLQQDYNCSGIIRMTELLLYRQDDSLL